MNRLRFLRNEKGESLEKISKFLNVTIQTISNYETEKRDMSPDTILKLADYFNVSTDYLLCKTDVRNPGQQIDDVLNEAMIGMSKDDYEKLTDIQKKQIRDFALFVKNQNKGDKN
jgi:transcriptional regulator with XRE-family HTH domain